MKRKKVQSLVGNSKKKKETQANLLVEDSACAFSSTELTESIEVEVNSADSNSNTTEDENTTGDINQGKDRFKGVKVIGLSIKWILDYIMRVLVLLVNTLIGLIDGLQWIIISIVLTIAATFILRNLGISVDDIFEVIKSTIFKK